MILTDSDFRDLDAAERRAVMEFTIRPAGAQDAGEIAEVIQTVYSQMEHKEWFVADAAEYFIRVLSSGKASGFKAVDMQTGATAGVLATYYPGEEKENMGRDVGLSEAQCALAAHMDTMAVLPAYRGHHLQYQLMMAAEQELYRKGYRYLLASVHPDNHASKNTMLHAGYRIMATKEKYGGYLRHIMLKTLPD